MHELGVVFAAISTLEDLGRDNDLTTIGSVRMRLGEVSGILEDYFCDCWRWACARTELLRDARLELERVPAITLCQSCGETYGTVEHGRTCPSCGSENTVLVQGAEVEIVQVEGS